MNVILSTSRGFCSGVKRALDKVDAVLKKHKAPIYIYHEIVHNRFIVDDLKARGVIFVENLDDVPDNAVIIFSAHGVCKKIEQRALSKELIVYDATCPLVKKIHHLVERCDIEKRPCILIGHKNHPEVIGSIGQHSAPESVHVIENLQDVKSLVLDHPENALYVTQTTLSVNDTNNTVSALHQKYPQLQICQSNICYATQKRQNAVKALSKKSDLILVVGSTNSSNANRLKEAAEREGCKAYLIDHADCIDPAWLEGVKTLGVTAGASTPECLVDAVLKYTHRR